MPYQVSLDLVPKISQNLKQFQRLIMTPQMQQAIHLLQMPIMELTATVEAELEQNPILSPLQDEEENADVEQLEVETQEMEEDVDPVPEKELDFEDQSFEIMRQLEEEYRDHFAESDNFSPRRNSQEEKLRAFLENSIQAESGLFDTLMKQAQETLEQPIERQMAEMIIGNFDENGFLKTSLEEIANTSEFDLKQLQGILRKIQTFEPFGVGGTDLRESMLIQLRCQKNENSLAYAIIEQYYEDLVQNRIPLIVKGLGCSAEDVSEAIENHISKLDLHPGTKYNLQPVQYIVPDVTIVAENEHLAISVNDEYLPSLHLNMRYMRMLRDQSIQEDVKEFIRNKLVSAKWLMRNILQRNETIERIALCLAKHQKDFFRTRTANSRR